MRPYVASKLCTFLLAEGSKAAIFSAQCLVDQAASFRSRVYTSSFRRALPVLFESVVEPASWAPLYRNRTYLFFFPTSQVFFASNPTCSRRSPCQEGSYLESFALLAAPHRSHSDRWTTTRWRGSREAFSMTWNRFNSCNFKITSCPPCHKGCSSFFPP